MVYFSSKKPWLAVSLIAAIVLSTACGRLGGEETSIVQDLEPRRVPIRRVQLLPDTPLAAANFSAVLPEGWDSVDTLELPLRRLNAPPEGILAKSGASSNQVQYAFTAPDSVGEFRVPPGYHYRESVIDGATVVFAVPPDPFDGGEHHRINAHFWSVPGDDRQQFGLSLLASSLNGSEYLEVMRIIESIRYAPPAESMRPPNSEVTPGLDWERVDAQWPGEGRARFSVLAPPGTNFESNIGYDSLIGKFTIGKLEIAFEYGGNASPSVTNFGAHIRNKDEAEHQYWVEVIDGKPFAMYRPANENPVGRAYTGISVARIPGLPDLVSEDGSYSTSDVECGGSFFAIDIDRDQQELVLAILRTIRAEHAPSWCD